MGGDAASLEALAYQDELTGLYNRRYLAMMLPEVLHALGTRGESASLLMIDLDYFKQINDLLGHGAGDEAIRRVAHILQTCSDEQALVARYAGDEFIVLLPNTEQFFARVAATDLLREVQADRFWAEHKYNDRRMSLSIGVSTYPDDSRDPDELIALADRALYLAKQRGRGCVALAGEQDRLPEGTGALYAHFPCKTVIGRDRPLRQFKRRLEMVASAGEGGFLLLQGAEGIGKTRMARAIVDACDKQQQIVVHAPCRETDGYQAYRPIVRLLEYYLVRHRRSPERLVRGLPDDQAREVIELMPRVRRIAGAPAGPASTKRRQTLFRGLASALMGVCRERVMVIVLEDMHFLDGASLALLRHIIEQERFPMLVVGSLDGDGLRGESGTRSVARWLAKERESPQVWPQDMQPLTPDEAVEMTDALLPGRPKVATFDALLYRHARGRPLLIEETLKLLIDRRVISRDDQHWEIGLLRHEDLPRTLREVVSARMERLEANERALLAAAAESGSEVGIEVLIRITGMREGEVLDGIDKLARLGYLQASIEGSRSSVQFSSRALREIYRSLTPLESRQRMNVKLVGIIREAARSEGEQGSRLSDSALARMAWHTRLADQRPQAEQFARAARQRFDELFLPDESRQLGAAPPKARPQPSDQPLPPAASGYVPLVIQGFLDAIHAVRGAGVPGPQAAENDEVISCCRTLSSSLEEVFANVDVLTFNTREVALRLNGVILRAAHYGDAPAILGAILRDAHIESMSLAFDVRVQDLARLVAALAHDPPPVADPSDWNAYLDEIQASAVGVVSARDAKDRRGGSSVSAWRPATVSRPNKSSDGPPSRELPPGLMPVAGGADQTHLPRGRLIVAPRPSEWSAAPKTPEPPPPAAAEEDVSSAPSAEDLPMARPVEEDVNFGEAALATQDAVSPRPAPSQRRIERRRTRRMSFDTHPVSVSPLPTPPAPPAVHAGPEGRPDGGSPDAESASSESLPGSGAQQVRGLAPGADAARLSAEDLDAAREDLHALLDANRSGAVAEALRRWYAGFDDPSTDAALLQLLQDESLLRKLNHTTAYAELETFICEAIEQTESGFEALAPTAVTVMRAFARLGSAPRAAHVARVLMGREGAAEAAMAAVNRCDLFDLLFSDLLSGEGGRQEKAAQVLRPLTPYCRDRLTLLIRRTDDYRLRRAVAEILHEGDPGAGDALRRALGPGLAPAEYARVLEIIDTFEGDPAGALREALACGDEQVLAAAETVLRRLPPADLRAFLEDVLHSHLPELVEGACEAVGHLGLQDAADMLRNVLVETEDPRVLRACCTALGQLADRVEQPNQVVRQLAMVVGFCGDRNDKATADCMLAALWALSQFGGEALRVPLRRATAHPDRRVQAYASAIAQRLGLEESNDAPASKPT